MLLLVIWLIRVERPSAKVKLPVLKLGLDTGVSAVSAGKPTGGIGRGPGESTACQF